MAPRPLTGVVVDVLAWYAMPAVFLFLYVGRHYLPAEAIVPHLRVVCLTLLALVTFRLGLALAGLRPARARIAAALAASLLLSLMLAYYVLLLVGLQSWGRVVSWDLITSYGGQFFKLADALDLAAPVAIGVPILVFAALSATAWIYLGYFDWAPPLRRALSTRLIAFMALAAGMFCSLELYRFVAGPPTQESEPVSLTFFPTEGVWDIQGHVVDRMMAAHLDAAEEAARKAYVPAASTQRKNVIVIVVDALRPDHMGIYGYQRDTTPHLSRLERAGILRKASMRSSCASSVCGLLSISTSRSLHQFSQRAITLQEVLKRHNYRVHMILSGNHASFYGLRKTYGPVDSYFDGDEGRSLEYLNDDRLVLERVAGLPHWDGEPVMFQFHLMSAHPLGARGAARLAYAPAANYVLAVNRDAASSGRPGERAINFYDNGVLQADAMIGNILDTLKRKGYLENTVVAITADHGEALGEHGLFQHGNSVREEVLRIPFLLVSYGYRAAAALDSRVLASQIDIAPTLLAELGLPRPRTWNGAPLQQAVARDFLYFQELWEAGLYDLRDADSRWKYWTNLKTGEEYAFNLSVDPREQSNQIDHAPAELTRAWRARLLAKGALHVKGIDGWRPPE